jgi:hypothetical protein
MRAKIRLFAVVPALCFVLLASALAQTNTNRQGTAPQTPSVANPNPDTATPRAPDMQTYRGMLQKAMQDLRGEISRVEGGAAPTQRGAMSPDVIHLMQTARNSWQIAQRAPANFATSRAYDDAMQEMRHRVADISHERPSMPAPEALNAARGVLQSLEKLNQAVSTGQPS